MCNHEPMVFDDTNGKVSLISFTMNTKKFSGRIVLDICIHCNQLYPHIIEKKEFDEVKYNAWVNTVKGMGNDTKEG